MLRWPEYCGKTTLWHRFYLYIYCHKGQRCSEKTFIQKTFTFTTIQAETVPARAIALIYTKQANAALKIRMCFVCLTNE